MCEVRETSGYKNVINSQGQNLMFKHTLGEDVLNTTQIQHEVHR